MLAKQSTAKTVIVGPILDIDGAPYTTDDLDYSDFVIAKNGSVATLNSSATVSHYAQGHFIIGLTATDCDTLGAAQVLLSTDGLAMSPTALVVVPANVYDSYVLGTDYLQVDTVEFAGQSITCAAAPTIHPNIGSTNKLYVDAFYEWDETLEVHEAGGLISLLYAEEGGDEVGFDEAMVGRLIYLEGDGITNGFYEIAGYNNSSSVYLASSPGGGTETYDISGWLGGGVWLQADLAAATLSSHTIVASANYGNAALGTTLQAVVGDTNELQTNQGDWATISAAGIRSAIGMASADLDEQMDAQDTAIAALANAALSLSSVVDAEITVQQILTLILATAAGKVDLTDNGDGTITVNFYQQDGTTEALTVNYNKLTGARSATGTIYEEA